MDNFIKLSDALDLMDAGEVFSIKFCTADRTRGTGGELRLIERAIKSGARGKEVKKERALAAAGKPHVKKAANARSSYRNIYQLGTHDVRKIHIRLITHFNGKRVIW
jgi:hypothetical protein